MKGDFQARFCERLEMKCFCLLDSFRPTTETSVCGTQIEISPYEYEQIQLCLKIDGGLCVTDNGGRGRMNFNTVIREQREAPTTDRFINQ